jgi:hypothetical protein
MVMAGAVGVMAGAATTIVGIAGGIEPAGNTAFICVELRR